MPCPSVKRIESNAAADRDIQGIPPFWCLFLCGILAFGMVEGSSWLRSFRGAASGTAWEVAYGVVAVAVFVPTVWWLVARSFKVAMRGHLLRFDAMLQTAPDAVVAVDERGQIVLANVRAHAIFGYPPGTLTGQSIASFVPSRFRGMHESYVEGFHQDPHPRRMGALTTLKAVRRDGTEFPVDISLSSMPHGHGRLALAFIRDVSEQRALWDDLSRAKIELETEVQERRKMRAVSELLQAVRSREEVRSVLNLHLEHLFPGTSGAVLLFDSSRERMQTLVDWGPEASAHESFQLDTCWAARLGKPYGVDVAGEMALCSHVAVHPHGRGYLCVPMLADGETLGVFHIRGSSPSGEEGEEGQPGDGDLTAATWRRAIGVAERLALPLANLRLRETLRDLSIRDGLTGVFNRRYLEDALGRELSRAARGRYPVSVVMFDLDHFKRLNDTFGHSVGDEVLRSFGTFLVGGLRGEDIVCRYGGEEFAVILPGSTDITTAERIEALRKEWEAVTGSDRGHEVMSTTFSAGVASGPKDGTTADQLLEAADRALYRAKSNGRNCVVSCGVPEASVSRT